MCGVVCGCVGMWGLGRWVRGLGLGLGLGLRPRTPTPTTNRNTTRRPDRDPRLPASTATCAGGLVKAVAHEGPLDQVVSVALVGVDVIALVRPTALHRAAQLPPVRPEVDPVANVEPDDADRHRRTVGR